MPRRARTRPTVSSDSPIALRALRHTASSEPLLPPPSIPLPPTPRPSFSRFSSPLVESEFPPIPPVLLSSNSRFLSFPPIDSSNPFHSVYLVHSSFGVNSFHPILLPSLITIGFRFLRQGAVLPFTVLSVLAVGKSHTVFKCAHYATSPDFILLVVQDEWVHLSVWREHPWFLFFKLHCGFFLRSLRKFQPITAEEYQVVKGKYDTMIRGLRME